MNDSKGTYTSGGKLKDSGIKCSDLPSVVATAPPLRHTYGPGFWSPKGPDPTCSSNYLKR